MSNYFDNGGYVGAGNRNITTSCQEYSFRYTFTNALVQAIQVRLDGNGDGPNTIWFDGLQLHKIS